MFKLRPERINLNERLGTGAFGSVYSYGANSTDQRYAIKLLRANDLNQLQFLMQEVVFGFSCDHPAILPVKGYYIEPIKPIGANLYIKMPRMKETLRHVLLRQIEKKTNFQSGVLLKYFHTLLSGLEYLHKKGIAHRDIKPENVLVGYQGEIRLADIGGAKLVDNDDASMAVTDMIGTRAYVAPEILDRKNTLKKGELFKTDLWSVGVLMVELCTLQCFNKDTAMVTEAFLKEKLLHVREVYSEQFINLILAIISTNPTERKSITEVKSLLQAFFGDDLIKEDVVEAQEIETNDTDKAPARMMTESLVEMKQETFFSKLSTIFKPKVSSNEEMESFERRSTFSKVFNEKVTQAERWFEYFSVKPSGFDISIVKIERIKDTRVRDFTKDLSNRLHSVNTSTIHDLSINFKDCKRITDDSLAYISATISVHLHHLQTLKMNFTRCIKLGNQGINYLTSKLGKKVQKLEVLELDFSGAESISNQGLESITVSLLPNCPNLRQLQLHFYGCFGITDCAVTSLSKVITSNLNRLEKIGVTFSYCESVTDKGLTKLVESFRVHERTLKHLDLNFVSCKQISDNGFNEMAEHVGKRLVNLTHLDLNFGVWDKVTDPEVKDTTARLEENDKNLSYVGFSVKPNKIITGIGITNLITNIGNNLSALEHLSLNFSFFSKITDVEVTLLAESIGDKLKNLKYLDINLNYCKQITDDGLRVLCEKIGKNLLKLEYFRLNLWSCHQITNQGLMTFSMYIAGNLKDLKHLEVDFDGCKGITNKGIQDLSEFIRLNLKSLVNLEMSFCRCPDISDFVKEMFKKSFNFIPHVNIRF